MAKSENYGELMKYHIDFYLFVYLRSFKLSPLQHLTNNNNTYKIVKIMSPTSCFAVRLFMGLTANLIKHLTNKKVSSIWIDADLILCTGLFGLNHCHGQVVGRLL